MCLSWCLTQDPFGEKRGRFDYQGLLARLGATHRRIREKLLAEDERNEDESDSETSSSGTDPDSQGSSHPWPPGQCRSQKWGQGLKSKATFFCFIWNEGGSIKKNHTECNIYSTIKNYRVDSCFRSTNVAERWNIILSQPLKKMSSTCQMLGHLVWSSTFTLLVLTSQLLTDARC